MKSLVEKCIVRMKKDSKKESRNDPKRIRKRYERRLKLCLKPEYYIGIDMIDQEHKQLFDYANEAYELLQEEFTPDKYDRIDAILEKLRDYTVKHFSDEEAYMESIQYKKIFTQKIQHQEFINKLDEFIDQHEKDEGDQAEQDEQIMDILNYLTDWLINHILHVDGQIPKEA